MTAITIGMELARPTPRPTAKGTKVLNLRADDPLETHPSQLKGRSMRLLSLGWGLEKTSRHVGVSIEQLREWRDAKS